MESTEIMLLAAPQELFSPHTNLPAPPLVAGFFMRGRMADGLSSRAFTMVRLTNGPSSPL